MVRWLSRWLVKPEVTCSIPVVSYKFRVVWIIIPACLIKQPNGRVNVYQVKMSRDECTERNQERTYIIMYFLNPWICQLHCNDSPVKYVFNKNTKCCLRDYCSCSPLLIERHCRWERHGNIWYLESQRTVAIRHWRTLPPKGKILI